MQHLNRRQFPYTACFCEENIWHLARHLIVRGVPVCAMQAVVLSNEARRTALREQRAVAPGEIIFWDYHVVLWLQNYSDDWIFDFDTRLPFVTERQQYAKNTFVDPADLPDMFHPWLRIIPMREYLNNFSSDRSHMRDANGQEIVPFPLQPAIQPANNERNISLQEYVSMKPLKDSASRVVGYGEWL